MSREEFQFLEGEGKAWQTKTDAKINMVCMWEGNNIVKNLDLWVGGEC
jgi:hypothetical protein